MKKLIIIACLMLTACAGMTQAQQAPAPSKPQPASAAEPVLPPDNITVTLPRWPGVYAYHSKDPEAIIIMSVKEPDKFPVPSKFTFKRKDGTSIEVPLLQPDKAPDKGKVQ
jgi:hypothetical protein